VAAGKSGHESAYPYRLFAQGLARYRLGRFDEAIMLMTGETAAIVGPSARLVLAMAQHQLGQHEQAVKTLAVAISSYDWSASKADNHDAWIAHILRREAEALILPDRAAFPEDKYQLKE
jgi:serine/threonine-protein kinase